VSKDGYLLVVAPFRLYTNVLEEHTISIFRAEVRRVRKWMVYVRFGRGSGQGDRPVRDMG
jgi:hypothetical protein